MTTTRYGLKTRTGLDPEEAEAKVRDALQKEGFGILTVIDVEATMREKLGLEIGPYRILGACNPNLASQAIAAERDIGLLLPCNVVVYREGDETVVAAMEPGIMTSLTENPALEGVATDARARLERALATFG